MGIPGLDDLSFVHFPHLERAVHELLINAWDRAPRNRSHLALLPLKIQIESSRECPPRRSVPSAIGCREQQAIWAKSNRVDPVGVFLLFVFELPC